MGRIEDPLAKQLMTAGEVACYLLKTCRSLDEFESFMFGSSLSAVGSDYDILIVGPSGAPLTQLKLELRVAGRALPLDVLFMLPTEAEETGFIMREGCINLWQLADFENR